jgi:hypothetical protein
MVCLSSFLHLTGAVRLDRRRRENERDMRRRKRKIGWKWSEDRLTGFYREWTGPVHLNQSGSLPNRSLLRFWPFDLFLSYVYGVDLVVVCSCFVLWCATYFQPLDLGFWWDRINPTPLRRLDDPDPSRPWAWVSFHVDLVFYLFFCYLHTDFWFSHLCYVQNALENSIKICVYSCFFMIFFVLVFIWKLLKNIVMFSCFISWISC